MQTWIDDVLFSPDVWSGSWTSNVWHATSIQSTGGWAAPSRQSPGSPSVSCCKATHPTASPTAAAAALTTTTSHASYDAELTKAAVPCTVGVIRAWLNTCENYLYYCKFKNFKRPIFVPKIFGLMCITF